MVIGQALSFGVTADVASLLTQKTTVNNKSDKKEARDKTGKVVAVSFYNRMSEISTDGLGVALLTPGSVLSIGSGYGMVGTAAYVDECTVNQGNEDFENSSIKGTSYEGI